MKIDELFSQCFANEEIEEVLVKVIKPELEADNIITLDFENKSFRPSLVYCVINYLVDNLDLDGFKEKVKLQNINASQKSLIRVVLSGVVSMNRRMVK